MHLRLFSSLSLSLFQGVPWVPCASDSPFSLSLSLSLSSSSFVTAQRRRGRRGWSRSTESNGWKNNSKRYVFIKHPCPSNEPRVITHTPLAPQASKPETKSYSRSLAVKPCVSTKVRKRKSSSYSETRRFSGYYRTNKKSTRTA